MFVQLLFILEHLTVQDLICRYVHPSRTRKSVGKDTWEELIIMAPEVKKAEMMGRDSRLHRKPSRSTASSRYSTATIRDTCNEESHCMHQLSQLHRCKRSTPLTPSSFVRQDL